MKKKILIFNSFPDFSDNSYALFQNILRRRELKNYKKIWLLTEKKILEKLKKDYSQEENVEFYLKKSIQGIYYFVISEKVFTTHGIYNKISCIFKKKIVNLWHGMPLKNIELLDGKNKKVYAGKTIATSKLFVKLMMKAFGEKIEDILLVGQPRNDLFFEKTNYYKKKLIEEEKYLKKIIWLPTYRRTKYIRERVDSSVDLDCISVLKISKMKKFNEYLKNKNYLLLIKLHPMDCLQEIEIQNYSNIKIIKSKELEEMNEQLYPLLGSTDLLITDYSSVWVDYEILNKPIYFVLNDYEEYKKNRGFTIENLPEILPGKIIQTYEELIRNLEIIPEKLEKEVGDLYNNYKDNKSCERILKKLKIIE